MKNYLAAVFLLALTLFFPHEISLSGTAYAFAKPAISSFSPTSGSTGTSVTINGINFTGATGVSFNGGNASFTVNSNTSITATVPATASTGPIIVTTPGGSAASRTSFTFVTAPPGGIVVSSFTPTSGAVGDIITINGSGFTSARGVRFGSSAIATNFTVVNDSTITIPVSASAVSGAISVISQSGNLGSLSTFTVTNLTTGNVTTTVNSATFTAITDPNFVGNFTINTSFTNNGPRINAPIYFVITDLSKIGTDLAPGKPDLLRSADNTAGTIGDRQTTNASALPAGGTLTVNFVIGLGSRQGLNFTVDMFGVLTGTTAQPGTAKPVSDKPVSLGSFHIEINDETIQKLTHPETVGGFAQASARTDFAVIEGAGAQSTPSVAIDINNPNRIAVAANDLRNHNVIVKTSQDSGNSWQSATLANSADGTAFFQGQSPVVAFNQNGEVMVVYTLSNLNKSTNALVESHSVDGINFTDAHILALNSENEKKFISRPVIATDNSGRTVIAWDTYSNAADNFTISALVGRGHEFNNSPIIIAQGQVAAPALTIGHNGEIFLGWDDWGFGSGNPFNRAGRLMMSSSQDGMNFSTPLEIAKTDIGFGRTITAMPDRTVGPSLSLVADTKRSGVVYAAYTDIKTGLDILFTSTNDGGMTWRNPQRANRDRGLADQFYPVLALDNDGKLHLSFYDTSRTFNFETVDITTISAKSISNSGSVTFTKGQFITSVQSNDSRSNTNRDGCNLGDHISIAAQGGTIVTVWTDTRQGNEDIFINITKK